MISYMVLHISDDNEIYKISQTDYKNNKSVPNLAGRSILEVVLVYDTINRKPLNLIKIEFERIQLDSNFSYDKNTQVSASMKNFLNYAFENSTSLAMKDEIPIPIAPIIPSEKEKQILYKYLEKKYTSLYKNCSLVVETYIKDSISLHNEYKELVKDAYSKKV